MIRLPAGRIFLAAILMVIFTGCSSTANREEVEMDNYSKALQETDPATVATIEQGSKTEQEAIARFSSFYDVFSEKTIKENVRSVYASKAYFRDPFKAVIGIDEIEAYFLKSAETIEECTFDIVDVAVHEGDYYFRWMMHLTTKRYKNEAIHAPGMSHVRFDENGMVIFHQDYWDPSVIYEKIFLLGTVIRWIKGQF